MKIIVYILVIFIALIIGYYIYQIQIRKNHLKPNILPIFMSLSKEYKNINENLTKTISEDQRVKFIKRKEEIKNLINKFTGNE